ncbi:hypothetical protein BVX94_01820 [bacterium B17]|nr:hypothetical protein BVX94_01820 [bacterium B17]
MSRKGKVFNQGVLAGLLEESEEGYIFQYDSDYLARSGSRPICLTMPKQKEPYVSEHLFPFFHGLLAEGVTKDLQCRDLKIDENDHFGRLLKTANFDIIGSVTVEEGLSL